jgi:DNA-binding SARP family transcriptional activator/DNA-binding beta-propeller fold protein YncE
MAARGSCSFRILGPFEVFADGLPVDLGGRKPAELLALLVLQANEVVSADHLVDELWGSEPPRTARKTLQVHISRLRRELGDGILETRPQGYVLDVERRQVDAHVFEDLFERGRDALDDRRPGEAARLLREALALWRGRALAGMDGEAFARTATARLDDLRLAAIELRIEADLALGRHASVVGELQTLVAEQPYREGFRRQLMLALYRAGRQADALAAYRSARRTLVEELGVEPGPELRELEASMLRHDPSIATPRVSSAPSERKRRLPILVAGILVVGLAAGALAVVVSRSASSSQPVVVPDSVVKIDPRTNSVVRVTRVGRQPNRLAYGKGVIWVVNGRDRTVSRVRPSGDVETIGGVPYADHIAIDGNDVWVSSLDRASVARINAGSGEVVESIGVPSQHAEGLAVGGGFLWITNPAVNRGHGTETVSRFDLRARKVVSTIPVGKTPIFTTFGYGAVWVSNYDDDTVSVISPGSPAAETIPVCDGPLGVATGYGSVWVVCYWVRWLVRIDPSTRRVMARIPLGAGPLDVAAGADGVWVSNRDSRTLSRIDPQSNEVVAEIRFPDEISPYSVVVGGGAVWVSVSHCEHPPCL